MHYRFNNKGSVFVYALVLVTLSLVMASVILTSSTTLSLNHELVENQNKLSQFFKDDASISFKIGRELNSNGGGFVDNLRCPQLVSIDFTVPAVTDIQVSTEFKILNGVGYCYTQFQGKDFKLLFSSDYTDIITADHNGSQTSLSDSGGEKVSDSPISGGGPSFNVSFPHSDYQQPDGYDDDLNSDNWSMSSTGSTNYVDGYTDDDDLHRRQKHGFLKPGGLFESIFWSNNKTNTYIQNNTNNTGGIYVNIGDLSSSHMFVEFDEEVSLYLYKFNKTDFQEFYELNMLERLYSSSLGSGSGFLQKSGTGVSLSVTKTGNEYDFDFQNYDYAVLAKTSTTNVTSYKIEVFDALSNSGSYIVPIDDSDSVLLKYLGNKIILDEERVPHYEHREVISSK